MWQLRIAFFRDQKPQGVSLSAIMWSVKADVACNDNRGGKNTRIEAQRL